jgi:hypothetical protein
MQRMNIKRVKLKKPTKLSLPTLNLHKTESTFIREHETKTLKVNLKTCNEVLSNLENKTFEFLKKADTNNDHKLSKREVYFMLLALKKEYGLDIVGD